MEQQITIRNQECLIKEQQKTVQQQQGLLDFSSMFKNKGNSRKPTLKGSITTKQSNQPNWLLEIPAKLDITKQDLLQRRYMNMNKWTKSIKSKKQFQCFTALVNLINGLDCPTKLSLNLITDLINKHNYKIEGKTRRQNILNIYSLIKSQFKLDYQQIKIHQLTQSSKNSQFLNTFITNLKNPNKSFIYICYNNIFNLIGYQNTPLIPLDAYKKLSQINPQKLQMWIILIGCSNQNTPLIIKRWTDIEIQLTCRWPEYLDLEQTKKGKQLWNQEVIQNGNGEKKQVSCILEFTRK